MPIPCGQAAPGATVLAAVIFVVVVFESTAALADRHCSPVLDRYYGARAALHDRQEPCGERLDYALELLSRAVADARACGCFSIEAELLPFLDNADAGEADCEEREVRILGLDEKLADMVEECNF